jgi:two-component system, OmpR family, sensor kinase
VNPLLCYVRARLRRRLFAWFGATILVTSVAVAFVMGAGGNGAASWKREAARARTLTSDVFERVWEKPAERDAVAATVAKDLEVALVLEDDRGRPLASFGEGCDGKAVRLPVVRGDKVLGQISMCADRFGAKPFQIAIPLLVTCIFLWGASGAIARRLSRPMMEMARVASELGAGNFSARIQLGRRHRYHGEDAALAATINDMAARIERHLNEQRELLASVSHELRTPLARIRLLTEMARGQGADGKTLDDLDREVVEMDALVGDLLASSRIDFQVLSTRPLGAVEAAARALERCGVDAGTLAVGAENSEGDAEAGESDEGESLSVKADATLLGRALANLIDNAKKHGGGVATLRVRRDGEAVAFEVEDRGAGFVDGEEVRIFEPFYRRSENGSLGLGLSLVKRIAEAHGGKAYAENRKGGGARVAMTLPAARA